MPCACLLKFFIERLLIVFKFIPLNKTLPSEGSISLRETLPSVVLPLPDSPTMDNVSPLLSDNDTLSSAFTFTDPNKPVRAWKVTLIFSSFNNSFTIFHPLTNKTLYGPCPSQTLLGPH